MSVQDDVLSTLLKNSGQPVSGQILAEQLNVSRNAVWKAVKNLRKQEYQIESIPRKGYVLNQITTNLDAVQIKENVSDSWKNLTIITENAVTSTNDLAKQYLIDHPGESVLITAKRQTKGRGRRGKSFYSALDNGLYFSFAFKPNTQDINQIVVYTVVAAAALAETLEKYVDGQIQIKWVNDMFYKDRKVSGILSEMTSDLESGGISGVVIGIGLNLEGSFNRAENEVREVAGSLFSESIPEGFNPNQLLAEFLNKFAELSESFDQKTFLQIYKERLMGIGREVSFQIGEEIHSGIIKGINESAHLLVEMPDGELKTLTGQSISFSSRQFADKKEVKK